MGAELPEPWGSRTDTRLIHSAANERHPIIVSHRIWEFWGNRSYCIYQWKLLRVHEALGSETRCGITFKNPVRCNPILLTHQQIQTSPAKRHQIDFESLHDQQRVETEARRKFPLNDRSLYRNPKVLICKSSQLFVLLPIETGRTVVFWHYHL